MSNSVSTWSEIHCKSVSKPVSAAPSQASKLSSKSGQAVCSASAPTAVKGSGILTILLACANFAVLEGATGAPPLFCALNCVINCWNKVVCAADALAAFWAATIKAWANCCASLIVGKSPPPWDVGEVGPDILFHFKSHQTLLPSKGVPITHTRLVSKTQMQWKQWEMATAGMRGRWSCSLSIYICVCVGEVQPTEDRVLSCPLSPHSRCRGRWRSQGSATIVVFPWAQDTFDIDRFCTWSQPFGQRCKNMQVTAKRVWYLWQSSR